MTRIYKEIDLLSHEKHQAYRLSSIQKAVGLLSDALQLLHEVANLSKILYGPQSKVVEDYCVI